MMVMLYFTSPSNRRHHMIEASIPRRRANGTLDHQ
jgi:hypothetical protein